MGSICELIDIPPQPFFVERVFQIFDKDDSGSISFQVPQHGKEDALDDFDHQDNNDEDDYDDDDDDICNHCHVQEFLDAMHQFAGQTPEDKIKFLFKVYDIDGQPFFLHFDNEFSLRYQQRAFS